MKLLERVKAAWAAVQTQTRRAFLYGATASTYHTRPRVGDQWLEAYNTMPWLRATVGKIAYGIASLDWGITRTMASKGGRTVQNKALQRAGYAKRRKALSAMMQAGAAEQIENHPALELLADPCPDLLGKAFWIICQTYYEIPGEVFWLYEREDPKGPPVAIWPVPPTWVTRTPTPDRPTFDIQRGALNITEIPPSEMKWLKNPDPVNPYARGIGTALSLADELDADESAAKMVSWSFYNRGQGDLLVALPGATQKEVDAFRNNWQANLVGVTNALKTHFVTVKPEVEKLSHDFEHLQVLELRKYSRDVVLQVQGIPPEVMGIIENSNRATIEAADFLFAKHVIVPRAEIWREFLQEALVPQYDERALIDYTSPIEEDKEMALRMQVVAPHAFRVDEQRRLAGFDPLGPAAGGDLFVVNGVAVRSLNDLASATPVAGRGSVVLDITRPAALPAGPGGGAPPPAARPRVSLELGAGAPVRRIPLAAMNASPDEAIAIARWAEQAGYRLDLSTVTDPTPGPVGKDKRLEYLRRALAHLRGDPTKAWNAIFGPWSKADVAMLDRMLGVADWPRSA